MEIKSKKKILTIVTVIAVLIALAAVIIYSVLRAKAQIPSCIDCETFEKMKLELELFDQYFDVLYPDLSWMELDHVQWSVCYWEGRKVFGKTEPSGYRISGFQSLPNTYVHYAVQCLSKPDRTIMSGEEYRGFKTLFQQMKSSSSNIYEMYFQHNRKEYMASAAYEFGEMTDEEQQHMAKLLRADLERILFEMIDQTVK
jgi:hypothetical protein